MLILFVFCNIMYIPCIYSNNITSETVKTKSSKNFLNESHYEDYNKTKLNFISEGGSLLPNTVVDIVKLPKNKDNIFLRLDDEMSKNKEKTVVPRKGVVYSSKEDSQFSRNITNSGKKVTSVVHKELNNSKEFHNIKNFTSPVTITTNNMSQELSPENKPKTDVPRKPLVLSNEVLDKMNFITSDISDLPKDGHKTKVLKNPNSRPGMIMPIVITILVVPMFAVIGYLALKRGQEAWKNRHYKRMDFLLDGMYND